MASTATIWDLRSAPGGFTLLEVILLLMLIGILSVTAVPRFFHTQMAFALNRAAATIHGDICYAQDRSVTTRDNTKIIFTQSSNTYELRMSDETVLKTVSFPGGLTVTSADITFSFNSLGEPVSGGGGSVTIGSGGGESRTITVTEVTGNVNVS